MVESEPLELTVLPLPNEGKPAQFYGLVGRYTIEASATPTQGQRWRSHHAYRQDRWRHVLETGSLACARTRAGSCGQLQDSLTKSITNHRQRHQSLHTNDTGQQRSGDRDTIADFEAGRYASMEVNITAERIEQAIQLVRTVEKNCRK